MDATLKRILSRRRPSGTRQQDKLIADLLPSAQLTTGGNWYVHIGPTETIFSSHLDTRHLVGGFQKVEVDFRGRMAETKDKQSHCLGADDGAGVYVMIRMIAAGVPGLYLFHRDEEMGGHGSQQMAKDAAEMLQTYRRAVAFDRCGTTDVVEYQMFERCCSKEFVKRLAELLGPQYKPASGCFTDTYNYISVIAECTNISVGFEKEHSRDEYLDVAYLESLAHKVCTLDWESLPTVRDPKVCELEWPLGYQGYLKGYYDGESGYSWDRKPSGAYKPAYMSLCEDCTVEAGGSRISQQPFTEPCELCGKLEETYMVEV